MFCASFRSCLGMTGHLDERLLNPFVFAQDASAHRGLLREERSLAGHPFKASFSD